MNDHDVVRTTDQELHDQHRILALSLAGSNASTYCCKPTPSTTPSSVPSWPAPGMAKRCRSATTAPVLNRLLAG